MTQHNPLACILPPYVAEKVVQNGTPTQKEWAQKTILESGKLRGQRAAAADLTSRGERLGAPARDCNVYDAQTGTNLPGVKVRGEGDPPVNNPNLPDIDEAFDGATATYDFYKTHYNRNSIDDRGMALVSTVNYGLNYENAFWDGTQMAYGRGHESLPPNERLFNRFTIDLGVIGHELTHGVVQYEAGLVYFQQAGALNESWADVFGSLVRQWTMNQTAADADWIIGKGLFSSNVNGVGIRSMKAPGTAYNDPVIGKDPQPGHMKDYIVTSSDNGGVHLNSGIPNHAFYVTAREMGGYAWEKAGKIWYVVLCDKMTRMSQFNDAARLTHEVAGALYGQGSLEQQAVKTGWKEVGIPVDASEVEKVDLSGCTRLVGGLVVLLLGLAGKRALTKRN